MEENLNGKVMSLTKHNLIFNKAIFKPCWYKFTIKASYLVFMMSTNKKHKSLPNKKENVFLHHYA